MSIKSLVEAIPILGPAARQIAYSIATLRKIGGVHPRICPICGFSGRFSAFGDPPRWDAKCPACGSLERQRLLALFLEDRPDAIHGRVVHFAPEDSIVGLIRRLGQQYQSADLHRKDCDLILNLERLDLPDGSVDVFVASHVLEHVDDRKALSELYRCLQPGGMVIVMVPIVEAWRTSYENSAITSEKDRNLHFGQFDHVRYYGADLRDRIRSAGFDLEEFSPQPEECVTYGLTRGETVFLAKRPN